MEWLHVLVLILVFGIAAASRCACRLRHRHRHPLTMLLGMAADPALITVAQRMATGLDSFALLAIPFFILAGQLMNRGGIARRLIDFAKAVVGMLPGGLAYVHILASMLFGAISGSAVAAASAIGGVVGPRMVEEGYDKDFSAAVNISSATTGLIIPPSNILIVYSLASGGVSIGALFLAGYLPGILVGLSLMVVAGFFAVRMHYPVAGAFRFGEAMRSSSRRCPACSSGRGHRRHRRRSISPPPRRPRSPCSIRDPGFSLPRGRVRDLPQILLATVPPPPSSCC